MSSQAVRTAFRTAWAVPGIPYVETINEQPPDVSVDVPIWATAYFAADNNSHQTMGSKPWIEEQGVIVVGLYSYSGISDAAVVAAAEEVIKFWTMWISPAGDTWVTNIVGPRPPDPDAQGDVYRLGVDINYVHQYRGG